VDSGGDRFYRPALDGLRFFSFLAVFLYHFFLRTPSAYAASGFTPSETAWLIALVSTGAKGVDFFFCLSAYLITELLLREKERFGVIDVRSFLVRRALRIWPLYYAFLGLAAFVLPRYWPWLSAHLSTGKVLCFAFLIGNWECAFFGFPNSVAALLWTVSIEEQFYLLWPFVVRHATPRRLQWLCVAMLVVGPISRGVIVALAHARPAVTCNTFARLDAIALGGLVALALHGRAFRLAPTARVGLVMTGLVMIVLAQRFVSPDGVKPPVALIWSFSVAAVGATTVLVSGLAGEGGFLTAWPLVQLGRISYGLYVFHELATRVGKAVFNRLAGTDAVLSPACLTACLLLNVCLAAVSYCCLERPFLRLKTRFAHVPSRPD
jgi:peptidoglycan/LPS O-acetylase OafA/YrhL